MFSRHPSPTPSSYSSASSAPTPPPRKPRKKGVKPLKVKSRSKTLNKNVGNPLRRRKSKKPMEDSDVDAEFEIDVETVNGLYQRPGKPLRMFFKDFKDQLIYSPMVQEDLDIINSESSLLHDDATRRPDIEADTFIFQNFPYSGLFFDTLKRIWPEVDSVQLQQQARIGCPWTFNGVGTCKGEFANKWISGESGGRQHCGGVLG